MTVENLVALITDQKGETYQNYSKKYKKKQIMRERIRILEDVSMKFDIPKVKVGEREKKKTAIEERHQFHK